MDSHYDYKQHEARIRSQWDDAGTYVFEKGVESCFTVDTPPPTVSGNLHIGHIFSYTQTDIIARYKRMRGYNVFYPFGFDNNGLATERYVEKKRNVAGHALLRDDFIALCLEESAKAEHVFQRIWHTMGLSVDWNYTYSTISDKVRALAQESFIRLYRKNYIYRKNEPALYCPTCFTSVAQAELEDASKSTLFNTITIEGPHNEPLYIGTTRPELLFSCVCIFYHPDDKRYQHLYHGVARIPFFGTVVPIFPDDKVDPHKGTGLVMCCTFGDTQDIEWYKKHNLSYKPSMTLDGRWRHDTGFLAGLTARQARERIIAELRDHRLLHEQKEITHMVSVHERCKKEVEFIMLNQWFISIIEHKQELLALAERINWYPRFMKARYADWVKNLTWDWCISRQRFYGVPFPVWHCHSCHAIVCAEYSDLPVDPTRTVYNNNRCPTCHGALVPDTDVMDTWNISSLSPYICKSLINSENNVFDDKRDNFIPMSMRPQAHDIIRTWAFYTIVKTWMHNNMIPWESIVISGHVLSAGKEKISKSRDNNPTDPEQLLERYPADAIRYWTATGGLGHDIAFSETELKNGMRLLTKLWNAFRFMGPHITAINGDENPLSLGCVNEWILDCLTRVRDTYQTSLDTYEFAPALSSVDRFFWHDFCDMYVELVKNQLFNPHDYPREGIAATQWTLWYVGRTLLELYGPYIPHITDILYNKVYCTGDAYQSLHKRAVVPFNYNFPESRRAIGYVCTLVHHVRKLKSDHKLSLKTELEKLIIAGCMDESVYQALCRQEALLKGVLHVREIIYDRKEEKTSESSLVCDDTSGLYTARATV